MKSTAYATRFQGERVAVCAIWDKSDAPVFFWDGDGWQPMGKQVSEFQGGAPEALEEELLEHCSDNDGPDSVRRAMRNAEQCDSDMNDEEDEGEEFDRRLEEADFRYEVMREERMV
jgi:hypothetical protein